MMNHLQVNTDQIYVYPIKSGPPLKVEEMVFDDECLRFDRRWMIVTPTGQFITQRNFPKLNCLTIRAEADSFTVSHGTDSYTFEKHAEPISPIEVNIWNVQVKAFTMLSGLADWLSNLLNESVCMVGIPDRTKHYQYGPKTGSMKIQFQDSCPIHIVNLATVHWLNNELQTSIVPMRFRANLYVDLGMPFEEDHLEYIQINGHLLQCLKPTGRCTMINLPSGSDQFQAEPLKTLAHMRKQGNAAVFGIYARRIAQ